MFGALPGTVTGTAGIGFIGSGSAAATAAGEYTTASAKNIVRQNDRITRS
ncbi:hypothetical protein L829_3781 [Mycobacteroides abscessus MAB_030201_1075]|uniref:Uncharacterized protein n=2 Tax=Mycobacteroides abscessus TaxID=36809 RepID=A0A829QFN6_9MYCO|nr:hypothetical protein MA3A0122S_2917 [Mycobacteroides abscessus 3A-0122-S]EIV50869.1 hypothetical protein MA3A0930S_3310 [Mycobacteroides abscessus 3A-0930-S]ETZ73798.1 hypothetical protein L835_0877 [Mycobacteroides abscessus MAB_110811_1470]ETZ90199.1 hypothetical protein L829_3781 [Mycobacteroides abscessus MAB_030201_1075]EUA61784.1 hypothetical protein I542_1927 [Mycobacteroides abscessus 1948]